MKKTVMTAAVLGFAASIVSAQVYSQNIVGYVKKTAPQNGLAIQGVPFLGTNSVSVSELFSDTLPLNSKIYVYGAGGYSIEQYAEENSGPPFFNISTNWSPDTTTIDGTAGFWIQLPAGADKENVYAGEVPVDDMSISILPGLNLITYPFPASVEWTNTALSANASLGDKVYVWDAEGQTYSIINQYSEENSGPPFFNISTNWTDTSMSIDMANGFWYESQLVTTNIVVEPVPYSL